MARTFKDEDMIRLRFGGGLHSRASEEDIDPRECSDGENFTLDSDNLQFRPRKPFDLLGTLTSGIRGGATLLKSDGTISTLFQSGSSVYEWDGLSGFTSIGSVSSTAKIRGRLEHNWQLSDKVIITDLALIDPVKEWDGTTFQNITFTDEDGYGFGTFKSRYCYVSNERVIFANVHSNGTNSPHLIVGTQRGSYTQLTVANRPSSAANAADPFFLIQPDNQYINGVVRAFGTTVFSSKLGSLYKLAGEDATDFAINDLLSRGGSSSDEGLQLAVNDILLGAQGRIKSISATDKFGDVESSDISFHIGDELEDFSDWLIATNSRLRRTYFHPSGESVIYVLFHDLIGSQVSPWSKWKTNHSFSMNPSFMMNMLDPLDGLEYVFMGDSSGNIYRLEGSGTTGDGGTTAISAFRLSRLFSAKSEGKVGDIEGYIRYRRQNAVAATMKFEFSGEHVFKEPITFTIPGTTYDAVYGTTAFYGTEYFYGTDEGGIIRQPFKIPGWSNDFQIRLTVEDVVDWTINEIGIRTQESN